MPKITIDNQTTDVPEGATVLDAATALGIEIPTLCYLPGRPAETSCMVCVVRVEGRPRLVPACGTPAVDGMVVYSDAPDVRAARRSALELLLGEHLGDCLAPCHTVCPCQMDIPKMIRHIAAGRLDQAIAVVKAQIALPAVLGRICNRPCEKGCRRGQHDQGLAICLLKRWAADRDLARDEPYLPQRRPATGKRVTVVGGGATGLSAAWYLQAWGHDVTIFEAGDALGGTLRAADLHELLPPDVLDAEIDQIRRLGVAVKTSVRVGADVSLADLQREHDAVLLTTGEPGAAGPPDLGLETKDGRFVADKTTYATPTEGVFAAGPAMRAGKLIVRAVADGRFAAEAVDQYLCGREVTGWAKPFTVRMGKLLEGEAERFLVEATPDGRYELDAPSGGFSGGYTDEQARAEALRCLHCDCRATSDCRLRDHCIAYEADPRKYKGTRAAFTQDRSHPEILYEAGKCIACGICIRLARESGEGVGLAFLGRGFDTQVGPPFGASLAEALGKAARTCVDHCPTGALELREGGDVIQ